MSSPDNILSQRGRDRRWQARRGATATLLAAIPHEIDRLRTQRTAEAEARIAQFRKMAELRAELSRKLTRAEHELALTKRELQALMASSA